MKMMLALSRQKHFKACVWMAAIVMAATALVAQTPAPRIRAEVTNSMSTLKGTLHPLAQPQFDAGRVPADTKLGGMSIFFNRTQAQQAALESLIAAQQNPASPLFHQWLTPEQFAARFGMAQSDIEQVQTWLEQQGFSVDSVSRSRNMIRFSGSVGQVEQAFQTQMHYYNIGSERHFAPSTELSLPAAIAPTVLAVRNLDDFRPQAMHIKSSTTQARPDFTSSASGNVFFAPGDIRIAYDMNPLITNAVTGTGQSIVIVGQSSITTTDIENFQNAAGLSVKDPTQVLVPSSGTPMAFSGDQSESDLDLEWSGAMAPGANIIFVFTGSDQNFSVFDSIAYAVDQKIGNIISASYGACETVLTAANVTALEAIMSQGASQGQTILAAAGDSGSTACFVSPTTTNPTLAVQQALAVNYPASSPYATGVGGTEISQANSAYYTQGTTYWSAKSSADLITSALQYLPEVVWNDSAAGISAGAGLSATGGGPSALFTKPSWQTGVPGIPSDGKRDVPDVALYSSPNYVAYLYCTSDQSAWNTTSPPFQQASCNSGFRDSSSQDLTLAGGTSFATPIFAGMVAIMNQQKGYVSGTGLFNPTLYTLASNAATYSTAFHDITTGNNFCPSSGVSGGYCSSSSGSTSNYSAGAGYDLTTGLGSIDLYNLVTATTGWPAPPAGIVGTTTSVSASSNSPAAGANVTFTITVASTSGSTTPTGTLALSIDGGGSTYNNGGTTATAPLTSNGTATYTTSFATAGNHQIVAQYPGDTTHAASTGVASITVQGGSSTTGTFTLSATSVTIAQGNQGSSTITVTPANGYKGTVNITPTSSNASFCYGLNPVVVSGTAAATGSMAIDTNLNDCGGASVRSHGMRLYRAGSTNAQPTRQPAKTSTRSAFGLVGLFFAGLIGWRFRRSRLVACVLALGFLGFALSGCGSSSSSNTSDTPKGTYTITLSGQDSATSTINATTTFTLTVN